MGYELPMIEYPPITVIVSSYDEVYPVVVGSSDDKVRWQYSTSKTESANNVYDHVKVASCHSIM